MPEVLSRRLGRSSQQASHHDRTRAESECFHDVPDVGDAAISDDRHAELVRKLRHGVHRSRLGAADGHDLLRDTDGARTHPDPKTVRTGGDEARSLLAGDDIAGDDLELGERLLDPLDHLDLED